MGLDPNYLESLPNSLVDMYGLVEMDILADMARRLSTYDYFIPAAQYQNQKLQELGMVQSEIIAKLSAITGQSQAEIVALLTEAGEQAIKDDLEYYTAAEVYAPDMVDTEALYQQLNAGLIQTEGAFQNLTKTTANTATRQFELALDRAWLQINTGAFDYTTAIKNAIVDLSTQGLGAIQYPSGRVDSIEVAVRRAVVTGANQTAAKTQEKLANQLGVYLVEVTAHGGARPEHAKWQGQVFSRRGRVEVDGVVYEDLARATGYGKAGGLCGVNCRHNFHPYIPGTARTWNDKQLAALEDKKVEYNGVKLTEYEASQVQRKIEREIRKDKRTIAALEAAGEDASEYRAKLRNAQKSYTDFTKQTGIKKQQARTQIATGGDAATPAPNTPTPPVPKQTKAVEPFTPAKSFEDAEKQISKHAKTVEYKGVENLEAVNAVNESLQSLTDKYPLKQLEFIKTNKLSRSTAAQANYNSLEINTTLLNKPPKAKEWEKTIAKNPSMIEKYTDLAKSAPKAERAKYEKIVSQLQKEMKFSRWTVGDNKDGLSQIKGTIIHEYGHILADQYIGQITRSEASANFGWEENNPARLMIGKIAAAHYKARQNGDIYKMSMYADENEYEFFAEAFTMYELGEELPDYIVEVLEGVFKFGTM
jgi:hypothetical protein